jgi:hypothetical protein
MLHQDKLKFYFLIIIISSIYSCDYKRNKIVEKEKLYYNSSINIITKKVYDDVFYKTKDSLKVWAKNDLPFYDNYCKIDSLICFNKSKDRCVTAFLHASPGGICDEIRNFYGAKFNHKWYFFDGASYMIMRKAYQSDESIPLSFGKLHEIALDEVYSGYLMKKDKGFWGNLFEKPEYQINEDFFKVMESRNSNGAFGSCHGCKKFEEYVIYITNLQWKKPDKDGYIKYDHPTHEEMAR